MTINENFERFQYFSFETNFLNNAKSFKKLDYRLVDITKIEKATSPCKTALSEANIKTNRTLSTT